MKKRGQIYLGLAVSMGIVAILSQVIISLVLTSYDILNYTNARTNAKYLASSEMETIRNLPYDQVGTTGGIPSGPLSQSKKVTVNGLTYTITTSVIYIDDSFDQMLPNDLLPTDYKRIRIEVNWEGLAASRNTPVTLVTDVSPKGVETTAGGGTLSILVFDANGEPVPQADVQIVAGSVTPPINLSLKTDSNGLVILPGAPTCNSCYSITISKTGYNIDKTYTTSEVANPNTPQQSVITNQLTEVSFAIDLLSSLIVTSTRDRENNFSSFPNQSFILRGNKILGTDVNDNPVYKYNQTLSTGSSGTTTIQNLEWDTYEFIPQSSTTTIAGTNPLTPLAITPNSSNQFSFASSSISGSSLLAIFTDPASNPIASVSAQISAQSFTASASSGLNTEPDWGQTFFKGLTNGVYSIIATASGFLNYSGNIQVQGQTTEKVILTPQQ